jgi:hypothetical protein
MKVQCVEAHIDHQREGQQEGGSGRSVGKQSAEADAGDSPEGPEVLQRQKAHHAKGKEAH